MLKFFTFDFCVYYLCLKKKIKPFQKIKPLFEARDFLFY